MMAMTNEAAIKGQQLKLKGADYVLTGEVTEFGRKEVGDRAIIRHPRQRQEADGLFQGEPERRGCDFFGGCLIRRKAPVNMR